MLNRIVLVAAVALLLGPSVSIACWAAVPLEKLIADNPVIVVGKIEKVDVSPPAKDGKQAVTGDTAHIKVEQVLKNSLAETVITVGDTIPLAMPSQNAKLMVSTDLRYGVGTDGVWILEFKDDKYWATYPGDFRPRNKLGEIKALLQK